MKSRVNKITTNFHVNRILKEDSQYGFLSVIIIDLVFRIGKNIIPRQF